MICPFIQGSTFILMYSCISQVAQISALLVDTEAMSSTCWSGFPMMIYVQLVVAADVWT